MRSLQELRDLTNNRIAAHLLPEIVTQEEFDAYVQKLMNEDARIYLASTDWYIIRFMETGIEVPEEVTTNRELARANVVE